MHGPYNIISVFDPKREESISGGFTDIKTERKLISPQPIFNTYSHNKEVTMKIFQKYFHILFSCLLHNINCMHHEAYTAAVTF
jgi:hypothetical protein